MTPGLRTLRQEDHCGFKDNMGYVATPYIKTQKPEEEAAAHATEHIRLRAHAKDERLMKCLLLLSHHTECISAFEQLHPWTKEHSTHLVRTYKGHLCHQVIPKTQEIQ